MPVQAFTRFSVSFFCFRTGLIYDCVVENTMFWYHLLLSSILLMPVIQAIRPT